MPYIVTKTNVPISDLQEERIRHLLGKAIEVVPAWIPGTQHYEILVRAPETR